MRPNQISDSLLTDDQFLETVEEVVEAIQVKVGLLDDIQEKINEIKKHMSIPKQVMNPQDKKVLTAKQKKERKMAEVLKMMAHKKKKAIKPT